MQDHEVDQAGGVATRREPSGGGAATTSAAGAVLALQRAAGNRAVGSRRAGRSAAVQRHAEGAELPAKDRQVAELDAAKASEAPAATRSAADAKAQVDAASTAGGEYQKAQKLTPGAMSLASAQKILQGAFGDVKDIVPGSVVILADQPACSAKYDEVCIAAHVKRPDGSDWKAGDCAKDDAAAGVLTEGFAWGGVVYVNGKTTLVTATAHEILHNNAAKAFRGTVGETFNEGVTELLARDALTRAGVTVPAVTAYPAQVGLAAKLAALVGQKVVSDAYFGGPDPLVQAFEGSQGAGTWAGLKAKAEALDVPGATAAMTKPATGKG